MPAAEPVLWQVEGDWRHFARDFAVPEGIPNGREIEGLVETFDIAPTALDYAGAEIPSNMSATSLRPLIENGGSGKELVLCEYMSNDRSRRGICLRTERYKYIFWGPARTEQFFDLQEDPFELKDFSGNPKYQDEISHHRVLMIDWLMNSTP